MTWFYKRLILAGLCTRSLIFREGKSPSAINARTFSIIACGRDRCRPTRKPAVKLKVIRLHSTKQNKGSETETSAQPSTLIYLLKWGVMTLVVTAFISTTVVWCELWMLKRNMADLTSTLTNSELDTRLSLPQIYPIRNASSDTHGSSPPNGNSRVWFRWLQSKSQDPFTLLELCQSKNLVARRLGVKVLAAKTSWEDYQYRYVAQAADYRTLIGLSRSCGSDARFFLEPPTLAPTETPVAEELASLVLTLDQQLQQSESDCDNTKAKSASTVASILAHQHLQQKTRASYDKFHFWGFDGSAHDVAFPDGPVAEDQLLHYFLAAVAQLCCIPNQALLFVKKNGLVILRRIVEQYENTEMFTAVASVLGNLALNCSTHESIVHTGWLGVLKSWTEGRSSKLAVTAARVLANMDREWTTDLLDDGVVILHPLYRSSKTVHADMVFVHGLLGGAVKTWRQQDSAAHSSASPRTDCWPKDWLAQDCPHVRIVSVHYDTALSTWSGDKCTDKEKHTLEGRGRELLEKLHKAGVGERPIIWVGHSMGGLLIKQMLELCSSEANNPIRQQTCGLVLYSVPHHGLSIAALSSQVHYVFFPTTEVQELKADSSHLNYLHERFKDFVESHSIPCLSFGELNKTRLSKTLPKVLLVPPHSSNPGVGEFHTLPLNHVDICKPDRRDSTLYQQTLAFVHRCIFFSYMHRIRKGMSGSVE